MLRQRYGCPELPAPAGAPAYARAHRPTRCNGQSNERSTAAPRIECTHAAGTQAARVHDSEHKTLICRRVSAADGDAGLRGRCAGPCAKCGALPRMPLMSSLSKLEARAPGDARRSVWRAHWHACCARDGDSSDGSQGREAFGAGTARTVTLSKGEPRDHQGRRSAPKHTETPEF